MANRRMDNRQKPIHRRRPVPPSPPLPRLPGSRRPFRPGRGTSR